MESSDTKFKAITPAILRGIKDKLKFQQRSGNYKKESNYDCTTEKYNN